MPDLCTLAYVKGILPQVPSGATNTNSSVNDSVYALLISAASAAFVDACERPNILVQSFTETYSGDGHSSLILRNSPILSVQSLSVGGLPVAAYATPGALGYVVADNGYEVELYSGSFPAFTPASFGFGGSGFQRGFRNIAITYTAGYATVPLDVQQAVAEMVLWKKAKMPRIDLSTQTLNGTEVVSYNMQELPGVKATIARYSQRLSASARR